MLSGNVIVVFLPDPIPIGSPNHILPLLKILIESFSIRHLAANVSIRFDATPVLLNLDILFPLVPIRRKKYKESLLVIFWRIGASEIAE
jgi:hypothetical protein